MNKKKVLHCFTLAMALVGIVSAQTTVQIGMGTDVPANTLYAPVYRYTATSTTTGQRSNILYTQAELNGAGITSGAVISAISFHKTNANNFVTPSQFKVLMANSAAQPPLATTTPWADILTSHTEVYQNASFNLPASAGWVTWNITPFIYTGGSLEIAFENVMGGNGAATGNFAWEYTTGFATSIIGVASPTGATLNGTVAAYKQRPNIQITYTSGSSCNGQPNGGTTTGNATTCPAVPVTYSVTGSSTTSGLAYQWQSSPDGFVWTDIAGETGFNYTATISSDITLRRLTICTATLDTALSTPFTTTVNSFLDCYCTSNATAATNSSIRNVTLTNANINNTSTTACDQYTDFSSITGVVNKGLSYPVSVLVEDCEGTTFGTQRVAIFIDWNQDGDFTDADELVYDPGTLPGAATVLFSGSIAVPLTAATGITKMRVIDKQATTVVDPCGTYTTGETEDYLLNVTPPPANEAGVLAITRPDIASCSLGNQIWVNVQNLGSSDLTQANFAVKVNNINIPVNNPWTGNVPAQSITEIQLPVSYTLADGDSVYVSVSMPNGVAEDTVLNFNNVTARRVWAGLSGVKTINGPAGPNNYGSMNAAIAALGVRGVCDTVYFRVASGTYNSQHIFTEYPGAGAGKLAVFESATGNAADVVFVDSNTVAGDNYLFRFDGGDGYMLRNLTGIAKGATFSRVVDILNGADDLTFEGNTFIGDTAATYSTSDFGRVVVASAGGTDDHRTVLRNNLIQGGNRGVNLGGATGSYETGVIVEGNTIEKYAYIGAIFGQSSAFVVADNIFRPRTNLTQDVFGIYANGTINGANIERNDVLGSRPGSSIFLTNAKGAANVLLVANNFLYQGDTGSTGITRGILVQDVNSLGIRMVNNSIALNNSNAASGAISVLDGSEIEIYNNNVGSFGNAPVLRVEKAYSLSASNHNNFFADNVANIVGTAYATLADLQAGTGNDANSVSVNPGFTGTDLHTCVPELNGAALAMAPITVDFDGDPRTSTPDIGADEFVGDANGLLSEDDFLKCPGDAVTLGNDPIVGVTYSWTPTGSGSEITVTNAGTYVVTATSACGSFSDTAVVANKPLPDANFTATNVGLTGVFTNTSTNGTSYSWDFGDGGTSTDFAPSHVYPSGGTYSVTLTVTNDCGTDVFGPVPVNVVNAGIDEAKAGLGLSLFPNPSNGQFTVSMWGLANEATVISVVDVTGKTLVLHNVPAGTNQVTLDATAFASGVYSVKVSNGQLSKVIRLIRQ